ncbi:MAG TPA: hypothetical protein VFB78_14350 [Acidimicrobiales bacterium]|nr:hypothetical protein [Acidimicrobiales bacterium]
MTETEQAMRSALGVPDAATAVMIFDQAAHLDWDWIQTFEGYFERAYSGQGVNGAFLAAIDLMQKNNKPGASGPYVYSICEMSYLERFIEKNPDKVQAIKNAGAAVQIVGGGITSPDNLLPAGEAFIRNYLVGRAFLQATFPQLLPIRHCWIPDDFGHDAELPVVVEALGMVSASFARIPASMTAALLANGADFRWTASDGSNVFCHWMIDHYNQGSNIGDGVKPPRQHIEDYRQSYGPKPDGSYAAARTSYLYIPIDDDFQMPVENLLSYIDDWNTNPQAPSYRTTGLYAVMASFADFVDAALERSSAIYSQRFNPTPYWTGHYASRPGLKVGHYASTRALLAAEGFALLARPAKTLPASFFDDLNAAWADLMPSTHHDFVNGTANDDVYTGEQVVRLAAAASEATAVEATALTSLANGIAYQMRAGEQPVVIANPLGVGTYTLAEITGPVPSGTRSVRVGSSFTAVQPTYEGGAAFFAQLGSLAYTAAYLSPAPGDAPRPVTLTTPDGGKSYVLENGVLSVTIAAAANWGLTTVVDVGRGVPLLAAGKIGNDLVLYEDGGGLYQFGNEDNPNAPDAQWAVQPLTWDAAPGVVVMESGPLRARIAITQTTSTMGESTSFVREYCMIADEPIIRMTTTGAIPPPANADGYSMMVSFPFPTEVDSLVHGTAYHWTAAQPLPAWAPPVFQATHDFVLPQASANTLAAIYHPEVPAWAIDEHGVLIGCVLRNTPANDGHGAWGSDTDTHTAHYALRSPFGLSGPVSGQPLAEARRCFAPPQVQLATNPGPLPQTGAVAAIVNGPGLITAAKPASLTPTYIYRIYQATNAPAAIQVALGAGRPSAARAVTALEDPLTGPGVPTVDLTSNGFLVHTTRALTTVEVTP